MKLTTQRAEELEAAITELDDLAQREHAAWLLRQNLVIELHKEYQRLHPQAPASDRIRFLNLSYAGNNPTMKRFSLVEIDDNHDFTRTEED